MSKVAREFNMKRRREERREKRPGDGVLGSTAFPPQAEDQRVQEKIEKVRDVSPAAILLKN